MAGWIDDVKARCTVGHAADATGMRATRGAGLTPCPACKAEHRGSDDKRGPVGSRTDGQGWRCFRCDASGDQLDLLALGWGGARLRDLPPEQRAQLRERCAAQGWCTADDEGRTAATRGAPAVRRLPTPAPPAPSRPRSPAGPPAATPQQGGPFGWRPELPGECEAALWADEGAQVLAYLQGRGFSEETLRHWRVGAHLVRAADGRVLEQYVALPVLDAKGEPMNVRFRSVPGACLRCTGTGCDRCKAGQVKKVYLRCPGAASTLFGVHQLDGDPDTEVVVTEGELDVLALWQYGLRANVVTGTAGAGTWLDEWLDVLEPYRSFLLAYDGDEKGDEGAQALATKLGRERCSRVTLPHKDAADCLSACVAQRTVHAALDAAAPMMDVKLVRVDTYADAIEQLVQRPSELRGLPTGSAKLDEALGGWRPGLVVVTGDTAAGKTSWTTWVAREQALRGVPVMLTSFEQRPIGTVQKLLRAQLGGDFSHASEHERRTAMAQLGQLPIYVLDHYGELGTQQVLEAVGYAVRRRGVKLAVIDHLGFLTTGAEDERRAIEDAVRKMAVFAVQREVTLVLICHPNNLSVTQQRRVMLGDLKGASAIRQDAHVGIVVERILPGRAVQHPATAVHVDKCRSEFGLQGARVTQFYDPESCVYGESWEATPAGRAGRGSALAAQASSSS
jgi:KaiC/GvpD/RAD55 family RecA-like ATPase